MFYSCKRANQFLLAESVNRFTTALMVHYLFGSMGADQIVGSESHSIDTDKALSIHGVIFQSSAPVLNVH